MYCLGYGIFELAMDELHVELTVLKQNKYA